MNLTEEYLDLCESQGPRMVVFDITNVCNMSCAHCPHGTRSRDQRVIPQHLDKALFEKAVRELSGWNVQCVRITGDGEPLLHPDIREMVAWYHNNSSIPLVITTNGTRLDEHMCANLLDDQVAIIDISLDAFYKNSFEKVRGPFYEEVIHNVFGLLKERTRRRSKTKVIVNAIQRPGMEAELEFFKRYWTEIVDFVALRTMHSAGGIVDTGTTRDEVRYPCPHLWKRMTINYKGTVSLCAHDWDEKRSIGNVRTSGVQELWRSEQLRSTRDQHKKGSYHHAGECAACTDWASSAWDYGYELIVENVLRGSGRTQ